MAASDYRGSPALACLELREIAGRTRRFYNTGGGLRHHKMEADYEAQVHVGIANWKR
jgi:hypothetical protein